MKRTFSNRDRRALALGAVLLLPPLLYRVAVRPYDAAHPHARNAKEKG